MTIGYEGATLDGLLACLSEAGVTSLIDVRERPYSRRKDFNKRRLSEALAAAGIDYLHLQGLGTPKPGRDAARAGDRERFWEIFKNHMKSEE